MRIDIILEWLQKHQPDVLCIQETKVQDCDFPGEAFDNTDYELVFKGEKSYNGVAVLSRYPIEKVSFGLDGEPKDQTRLVDVKVNGVNIINTYVPQGYMPDSEKFEYKLNWFGRLRSYFEKHYRPDDPVIWLGDLNVAPAQIDVHSPKELLGHVCFCPQVWEAFENVKNWGFTDILRLHHPEEQIFTFWDYRKINALKNNMGWRIDHILTTAPLAKKSTACYVDIEPRMKPKPSDHTFLVAEFDI